MEKFKLIQVYEDTHKKAKQLAKARGMTLRGYIRYLVEKDEAKTPSEKTK